jgi:hypothetical protein
MNKLSEYIKSNKKPIIRENQEHLPYVNVLIKGSIPKNISLDYVFDEVKEKLPKRLFTDIKDIIIGDFDFLNKKNLNSLYHDNKLYISNKERNEEAILHDIVHEIAHSVEKKYEDIIYGDNVLKMEFVNKRRKLFNQMSPHYPECHDFDFDDINYSSNFDDFLYKKVTYPKLARLSSGLFFTPYATTSLREYFADGVENYVLRPENRKDIYMMCPQLFAKVRKIVDGKNSF